MKAFKGHHLTRSESAANLDVTLPTLTAKRRLVEGLYAAHCCQMDLRDLHFNKKFIPVEKNIKHLSSTDASLSYVTQCRLTSSVQECITDGPGFINLHCFMQMMPTWCNKRTISVQDKNDKVKLST